MAAFARLSLFPRLGAGVFLLVTLLVTGLLVGGCDLFPTNSSERSGSQRLQISLLESGQVVTGISGSEPLRTLEVERLRAKASGEAEGVSFDHKHACTVSLYRPDGPAGPGYYVRSAELTYPDSTLKAAEGETRHLTARLWGSAVPHPSETNALLRCRVPAVEGAERRVRTFFRAGPEQLEASGFEKADSVGTGSVEAKSTETKSVEVKSVGNRTGAACTATVTKAAGGSSCWQEQVCVKNGNGGVGSCTEWRQRGSCSGGIGIGGLPGGSGSGGLRPIGPGGINGGPIPTPYPRPPNPGFDPDPCDSANPPDYCEIGCKLSISELMPEQKPWLALGLADKADVKTFKNLVTKFGGEFGLDNKAETKHFLGQVAHESESKILTTEDAINVSREEMRKNPNVSLDEPKRNGDKTYNLDRVMNSEKLQFSIKYGNRMGNGDPSTRDGWTYRGRGAIQLTGKNNYEAFDSFYQTFAQEQGWSHPDITENPGHVASNVRAATMAALHFWKNKVDGNLDSNPSVKEVTKLINGGTRGLPTRKKEYNAIKANVNCSK